MKLLVILALAAVAFANREPRAHHRDTDRFEDRHTEDLWELTGYKDPRIKERQFKKGHEYHFVYDAQLLSGVPQSSRAHAGTRMQCLCRLQFPSDNECLLRLEKCKVGQLNEMVSSPRAMVPLNRCDKVDLSEELKTLLVKPVQFKYEKGMISNVQFESEDKPWSMNIKKGVMNLLQVRLDNTQVRRVDEDGISNKKVTEMPHYNPRYDFFTTYEETMEGKCLTSYTFTKQPCIRCDPEETKVLNITKTIDFEGCRDPENRLLMRPEISYNFRFSEICPDNSCEKKYQDEEKFLESSSVYAYNITGDMTAFVIDGARCESQYVFTPYNEQSNVIVTYTNQTLVLVHSDKMSEKIPTPENPRNSKIDQSIVYTPYWDVNKEKFFMNEAEDTFVKENQYPKIKSHTKLAEETLKQLTLSIMNNEHSHVDEKAPRWLARMVKVLRTLKSEQIMRVFEEAIKSSDEEKVIKKDMLVDCLGLCGTHSCLKSLITLTKEKKINWFKAAIAIKAYVQARVVSKTMIDELLSLCEKDEELCKRHPMLKQSILLTCGSMIGAMCAENQDTIALEFEKTFNKNQQPEIELCPKSTQEEYRKRLVDMLKKAIEKEDIYETVLIIKTITNAALPQCITELEKVIRNLDMEDPKTKRFYPTLVRAQAIEAYRTLAVTNPKPIQRVLMPIYMNQREVPELRMIAVYQILQTLPERPILDQIARRTVSERSKHVRSFVTTYLMTLANSTSPCEKRMADDLKVSLRHLRPVPLSMAPLLSRVYHVSGYSNQIRAGLSLDAGVIKSNFSSYLPRDIGVSLHANVWGFWRKYLVTLGIAQQDMDQVLYRIMGSRWSEVLDTPISELMEKMQRKAGSTDASKILRELAKEMKMENRESSFYTKSLNPMTMIYMRFAGQEYAILPLTLKDIPHGIKHLFPEGKLSLVDLMSMMQGPYKFSYYSASFIRELSRKIPTSMGMPIVLSLKMPTIVALKEIEYEGTFEDSMNKVKVHLKGKPSISSTFLISMEAWNPFVNSGVRVSVNAQVHVPVNVKVIFDRKSETPIKAIWKLPESTYQRTLCEINSEPTTFTRVWPTDMEVYEDVLPKEKVIVGEEWNRVYNIDYSIGRESLGTEFIVKGQVHRTPSNALPGTPYPLLSGPNHLRIIVKEGIDQPKEVEFELGGSLMEVLSKSPLRASEMDKEFDTNKKYFSEERFETDKSEEFENMPEDTSAEIPISTEAFKNTLKVVVKTRGESKERELSCLLHQICSQQRRHCEAKLLCKRSPIPGVATEPAELLITSEIVYPEMPVTMEDLTEDKTVKITLDCKLNNKQLVKLMIQGSRSKEQHNALENSKYHELYRNKETREQNSALFSSLSQYDRMVRASTLTQFKIRTTYDKTTLLETCKPCMNITNKLYRLVKFWNYWNTDVNQIDVEDTPKNEIRAVVKLDHKSFQMVNVTAEMPRERVIMTDVPLIMPVYPVSMRRRPVDIRETFMSQCLVQGRSQLTTFDGRQYRAPITTCYSVLAKDCSNGEQPRFAVMKKMMDKSSGKSKVKVISEECVIKMRPVESAQKFEIEFNGEMKPLQPYTSVEVEDECIVERSTSELKVTLKKAGVIVRFDGYTTEVSISPMYSGMQCGLCGHYTGDDEEEDEFLSSDLKERSGMRSFFNSYLIRDDKCTVEKEMESELEKEENFEDRTHRWEDDNEYDSREVSEDRPDISRDVDIDEEEIDNFVEERDVVSPTKATRCISKLENRKYCFSVEHVPVCPKGYYASEMTEHEKTIKYKCIDAARSLRGQISRKCSEANDKKIKLDVPSLMERWGESEDFEDATIKETVPKRCEKVN